MIVDDIHRAMRTQVPHNRALEAAAEARRRARGAFPVGVDLRGEPPEEPRYVVIDRDGWVGIDAHDGDIYDFDLARIRDPLDLLGWVHHLSEKPWMDAERIRQFVEGVAHYKGWHIYRNT